MNQQLINFNDDNETNDHATLIETEGNGVKRKKSTNIARQQVVVNNENDPMASTSAEALANSLPTRITDAAPPSLPTFHVRSRTAALSQEAAQLDKDPYESLDYEVCENELYLAEQKGRLETRFTIRKDVLRWIIFIQIGIFTALIACGIDIVIESLSGLKYAFLKQAVDENVAKNVYGPGNLIWPYLYWLGLSIVPVAIGSAMVTYIEPLTAGSGIPQVKCYLNGVKIPRIVRIKTLTIKAIGVITSVVGGLIGGKEGPMIHAGAVVAAGISQGKSTTFIKDFGVFKAFRDDHEKRDFVLGGAAAGVAAAFGAPIGGMLFSLEEAASFWNQNLIWRTLVASIISSFTLNIVLSLYKGLHDFKVIGLFNLGKFDQPLTFEYFEIPIFLLCGVFGGLLGATWNYLNTKINKFRKRYLSFSISKVLDAAIVSMVTVSIACLLMYLINDCRPLGNDPTEYPVQVKTLKNQLYAI